jgi:transposase
MVVDGAINGVNFLTNVQRQLVPTLKLRDIVIIDNPNAHEVSGVRAAIEAVGARVAYLPPCSPDLNPIETVFSRFKLLLRSAAQRTVDTLWQTCGKLLDEFSEPGIPQSHPTLRMPLHMNGMRARIEVITGFVVSCIQRFDALAPWHWRVLCSPQPSLLLFAARGGVRL